MCGNPIIKTFKGKNLTRKVVNFVVDPIDRCATYYFDYAYDSCDIVICGKCKYKYKVHKKNYYWSILVPDHIPQVQTEEYILKLIIGQANDTEKRFAKRH
jgi:hypothetical protein